MWDPQGVVPGSVMPAYRWMFTNIADIDTAYAEQVTVNKVFNVPYNKPIPMKDGTTKTIALADSVDGAHASALEEAKAIAADMKNQAVKDAVAAGQIPEIVALIAYMNSLK
jgi:cytochrome c oxidase cbb3-type subunit 2